MLFPFCVRHKCSAYIWDCGGRPVRLRQRVMPSHALRLFGSEATTAFQLNKASSYCPSSSSSDAMSHRARISVGQTARSFCNSVRRSIHESFGMGRTHSVSRIDEWMGWSSDVCPPNDADPVDSSGVFNRLSALMSRSTSYTVSARIKAIRMLKVRFPRCSNAQKQGCRVTDNIQPSELLLRLGYLHLLNIYERRIKEETCAMMLCR